MKIIKGLLAIFAVSGILVGIVYNLFLGITPIWLDITVAILVVLAFVVAVLLTSGQSAKKHE